MPIEVRPGEKADVGALSRMLGRAFYDDPVSMWMLPDNRSRAARMAAFFATTTRHHHLRGGGVEVACHQPGVGAAALWDPPGRWRLSWRVQLVMLPALIRAFDKRLLTAVRTVNDMMDAVHPDEPHWYLAVIGSDPTVRGRGFGQALMTARLDRCDAEHSPAYLESSKFENIAYYQRFGFRITGEIVLPDGPTLWQMWRDPR